jgi:hypothetical protein
VSTQEDDAESILPLHLDDASEQDRNAYVNKALSSGEEKGEFRVIRGTLLMV